MGKALAPPQEQALASTLEPEPDPAAVKVCKRLPEHEEKDPQLEFTIRPTGDDLDQGRTRRLSHLFSRQETRSSGTSIGSTCDPEKALSKDQVIEAPVYIDFEENDDRNPINYPRRKKWVITSIACFFTLVAAIAASAYNMGFPSMMRNLNASEFEATIGLSMFTLGFGVVPLVTASFSEEFGRRPLYIGSMTGFLLMDLTIACAKNIHVVQVARFLQGAFGSTGATMVGGTIADIWAPNERGLPMSIFAVMAVGGNGLGAIIGGWIQHNDSLQWKWIQWIQMIIGGACFLLLPFMGETRSSIIIAQIARKRRKETGDKRYRARVEDERGTLKSMIWVSCTRPLYLLFTEPIVASFSVWIGFAWGILYCMIESVGAVFSDLHGFNIGQTGTVFTTMVIGSLLGFATNFFQEYLYRKYYPHRGVEARLYSACMAAVLFPVGMFIYAWSCFTFVPWISLAIGITVFLWALFTIYLAVFSYLADCYGPFASSALAGQSLFRNLLGTVFPLFTHQMYRNLSYKWANTVFGGISLIMMPIPFILLRYGPSIRHRSKFSVKVLEEECPSTG